MSLLMQNYARIGACFLKSEGHRNGNADRGIPGQNRIELQSLTKADQAGKLIRQGGHISVQVLNEVSSIATRKLKMRHHEVREVLAPIRELCKVNPLTEDFHDLGFKISENYQLSVYDSMIVASSLIAVCETLLSEDMQDGLLIENKLRIRNPFHILR